MITAHLLPLTSYLLALTSYLLPLTSRLFPLTCPRPSNLRRSSHENRPRYTVLLLAIGSLGCRHSARPREAGETVCHRVGGGQRNWAESRRLSARGVARGSRRLKPEGLGPGPLARAGGMLTTQRRRSRNGHGLSAGSATTEGRCSTALRLWKSRRLPEQAGSRRAPGRSRRQWRTRRGGSRDCWRARRWPGTPCRRDPPDRR
jgi:hypothetical protein